MQRLCVTFKKPQVYSRISTFILCYWARSLEGASPALSFEVLVTISQLHISTLCGKFSLHHHVQTGSVNHPASYPMGTGGSFPVVNRPDREADHSRPSSAEVKECVELYVYSPILLHGVVLS
jgi:hypothetical protein